MVPPLTSFPLSSAASPYGGKSPLKDPIEAQRSSLHRSPTSKLLSGGQSINARRCHQLSEDPKASATDNVNGKWVMVTYDATSCNHGASHESLARNGIQATTTTYSTITFCYH
ncbi:hypothetical protein HKD37_17G048271 [Glycine soja]